MRLRGLIEHVREREYECPRCHHRYPSLVERFGHVLRVHARDYDEAVEILTEAMMPLFDEKYVSGPEGIEFVGVTNEDYVQLLCEDSDPVARAYSGEE